MNETAYNEIHEFTKQMRTTLLYDMKSPVSLMVSTSAGMKALIDDMDEKCVNKEDLQMLYKIVIVMAHTSEQLMSHVNKFGDDLEIFAKKYANSD